LGTTIVETVDALTPEWLNAVLDDAWSTSEHPITSVHAEQLGTGQMCDSYRVLATRADGSTATFVAKLPATDPNSRIAGLLMRAYEKEVRFYQELAPDLGVRTPTALHAEIDPSTGSFVLLLDDMAPATQGDQLAGCDVERATAALGELVNLHAPRWGDPTLADIEWLFGDRGAGRDMLIQLLPTLWGGCVDRYVDRLDDHVRAAGEVLFSRLPSLFADHGPQTVVHGDYRLDNVLFHPEDGSVAVLDWQTCTVGSGPADAAYFVGAGLLVDVRRAHESELFDHYLRALGAAGVDASRSECWELYRRGTWGGLLMAVAASMLVERTERGDAMFMAMASRHAQHALDLDAVDLLDP
jgi:hypothetical protein